MFPSRFHAREWKWVVFWIWIFYFLGQGWRFNIIARAKPPARGNVFRVLSITLPPHWSPNNCWTSQITSLEERPLSVVWTHNALKILGIWPGWNATSKTGPIICVICPRCKFLFDMMVWWSVICMNFRIKKDDDFRCATSFRYCGTQ